MSKGCWAWTTARRERRSDHDSKAGRSDALQSGNQLSSSLSTSSSSLTCWLTSSSSTSFIPSILQLDNTWQYFTSTFKMQVRACLSLVYCIEVFDISLRSLTIALTAKDNDGHTLCRKRASQFPDIAPWMMNMTSDPNLLSLLFKTQAMTMIVIPINWSSNEPDTNFATQRTSESQITKVLLRQIWPTCSHQTDDNSDQNTILKGKIFLPYPLISKLPTKMTVIRIMLTTQKMTKIT